MMNWIVCFCFMWLNHQNDVQFVSGRFMAENSSSTEGNPCKVDEYVLFVEEDAAPGSTLMDLPTVHGETWSLTESGLQGFLTLNVSEENHGPVSITFVKSPDLEEIRQRLVSLNHEKALEKIDVKGHRTESIKFTLECEHDGSHYKYQHMLILQDVNEHAPRFDENRLYNISISESSIVGSRVFSLRDLAVDPDISRQIITYALESFDGPQGDGQNYFKISEDNSHVVLFQTFDFDEIWLLKGSTQFGLNISATDVGTPSPLTSYATLTITVLDADDQGPAFKYPGCHKLNGHCAKPYFQAVVKCGYIGPLHLYPGAIFAEDKDTQNNSIGYSITKVTPDKYRDKFELSMSSGEIRVTKPTCSFKAAEILLTITAKENSSLGHSEHATVQIDLLANAAIDGKTPVRSGILPLDMNNGLLHHTERHVIESNRQRTTTLNLIPFGIFLVLFIAFTIVAAIVTYVWIQLSRAQKKRKEKNANTADPKQKKEPMSAVKECPLCRSIYCTGHADGITCFRECSGKPYRANVSDVDLNGKKHSVRSGNHCTDSMTPTSPGGYKVPNTPIPHARKALNPSARKSTSCGSSSSNSSNSSSTTESQSRKTHCKSSGNTKMPPAFVPTAITASNGYCRSGLFKSCGGNVELRSNSSVYGPAHQQPRSQGTTHGPEEKLVLPTEFSSRDSNALPSTKANNFGDDISFRNTSYVSTETSGQGRDKNEESETRGDRTGVRDDQYEGKSLRWRLQEKLGNIWPPFLKAGSPRVRFDDRNIWAFD